MVRPLLAFACLLFAAAVQADPLKSPACAQALEQLQAAREARAGTIEALRHQAVRACLGLNEPPPARSNRWAQPPISVAPPRIDLPAAPQAAAPRPLPPPVQIDRPLSITGCDPNGCWASDGTRLQRIGPNLMGPNGLCAVPGASSFCQ
jgi:hypothetical protein